MKKALINILKTSLLGILLFGVISCDNIFSNKVSDTENTETLLKISVDDTSLARTIYPSSDASLLLNFIVTCTREGFTTKTKTAADLDALKALVINFADGEEGNWEIKLEASYEISSGTNIQAIAFSDTQSVDVQKNKLNEVSFKLTTQNLAVGGLNIKVSFSGSADRVVASLKDEAKETSIDEKTFTTSDFTIIEDEKSITFTRSISDTSEALTSGTYYLLFSFYDTTLSSETPLNTLPNYVRIVKGLTTSAELSISLNEVYTITYEDNGGTLASGAIKTGKYSRKSIVNLPQMEKEGYIFAGWYESSDFSGTPVTKIEKGSSGNKTLYARFVSSTLYVSQSGNNENDGMTASTALASVNKAVEKIISYGNIAAAYTIKISGTITGGVNIASTLTTEMASSLTLEGVTGQTGDTWVDVLNGGFTDSSKGTTLAISSAVPVTLKNLKITGGYQNGGNGAGIELGGDSSLVMESGEISGNTGNNSGQAAAAGVYISHGGTSNFGATQIAGAKFTMKGGSICNNTGTGVTLYDGSNPGEFNMYGGTITGNSGYGVNLVYSTGPFGKFTMKGDAVVAANNKVFIGFPNGTKIYIAGELTGTAPVATISLNGYNENTEVVALAAGVTDTSLLSAACTKIEVAPNNGTPWYLTSDGKLTSTDPNGSNTPDTLAYVDLGLPSGTLWANMNVGATSVTDIGTQFEWMDGGVDLTQLSAGDTMPSVNDMATINFGADWCMPTKEQFEELYNYCYFEPVTSYNGSGVSGYIAFKAKNENDKNILTGCGLYNIAEYKRDGYDVNTDPHIFIPADSDDVYLWSSTYYGDSYGGSNQNAYCFFFVDQYEPIESEIIKTTTTDEWAKHPVRPVYVGATSGSGGSGGTGGSVPDDFALVTGATITVPPTQFSSGGEFAYASTSDPVTVSSFYMCTHEVTQEEYEQYCFYGGSSSPSETSSKNEYPVYYINWYDAIVYCNLRSLAENLTPVYSIKKAGDTTEKSTKPAEWVGIRTSGTKYCGPDTNNSSWDWVATSPGYDSIEINSDANGYRLPTVAEWEYAARGGNGLTGTQTKYSGSSDVTKVSFDDYSIHKTMQKDPNTLQIYDMTGSVSEWLWDVAGEDYRTVSPLNDYIDYTGSAYPYERNHGNDNYIGFRVVRNAVTSTVHYTVNFDVTTNWSGNTDTVSSVIVEGEGKTVSAPDYKGIRSGYAFKGWYTKADPVETDEPFDFTIAINADMTLYAVWRPLGVGDIILNDGSVILYSPDLTYTEDQINSAIAVIYYVGTELNSDVYDSVNDIWTPTTSTTSRTLGVGLVKTNTSWCASCSARSVSISTIVQTDKTTGDKNGSDNLEQISAFLIANELTDDTNDESKYPAFYYAKNYASQEGTHIISGSEFESGWYLPSLGELAKLQESKLPGETASPISDLIYLKLGVAGMFENDWFLSSSQSNPGTEYNSNTIGAATSIVTMTTATASYGGGTKANPKTTSYNVVVIREF